MPETKNKPGIHLLKGSELRYYKKKKGTPQERKIVPTYYWRIVARNGRIIARSSETYTRKSGAVKSMKVAARIFILGYDSTGPQYYDHSKPDVTLKSYL